jgi:hypothetical protein
MALAAAHRARGLKWESVAELLGRAPETVRRWPDRYPEDWQRLYRAAECRVIAEGGAEARTVLRALLFSKDERVRCSASKFLATHQERVHEWEVQRKTATPLDDELIAYLNVVRGMTEEEHRAFIDDFVARYQREKLSAPPARPAAPEPGP